MSNRDESELAQAVCSLAHAICEMGGVLKDEMQWRRSHEHLATKCDLQEMEKRIMGANEEVIEFLKAEAEVRAKDSKTIDAIRGDMKKVKDALNDALATAGLSQAAREAIGRAKTASQQQSEKLEAFDAETDPVIPDPPPADPVDPNAPTDPNNPLDPNNPNQPSDPNNPIDPNAPSERLRRNR